MATKVVLNLDGFKKSLLDNIVVEQTNRLIEYAKKTTQDIGEAIKQYHSRNHMDRTGNLLDSLSWCVSYRGKVIESGYYQDRARQLSYLHEFDENFEAFPVGGHTLAERYIKQYGAIFSEGWRIFFTIRAPYWAYWEKGFHMKIKGKSFGMRQFAVMTQFFDKVSKDLVPAKVTFKNQLPPPYFKAYSVRGTKGKMKGSLEKAWQRYSEGKSNPYSKYSQRRYRY